MNLNEMELFDVNLEKNLPKFSGNEHTFNGITFEVITPNKPNVQYLLLEEDGIKEILEITTAPELRILSLADVPFFGLRMELQSVMMLLPSSRLFGYEKKVGPLVGCKFLISDSLSLSLQDNPNIITKGDSFTLLLLPKFSVTISKLGKIDVSVNHNYEVPDYPTFLEESIPTTEGQLVDLSELLNDIKFRPRIASLYDNEKGNLILSMELNGTVDSDNDVLEVYVDDRTVISSLELAYTYFEDIAFRKVVNHKEWLCVGKRVHLILS